MDKEKIYEEYHNKVLRYIQGKVNDFNLAEDLCSDVFVKVYDKLDTFDDSKASISTWIFTITRNRLIDYYRSRRVMVEIPEDLTYEQDYSDVDEDKLESLANGLKNIDDRSRKIIIGHYYDGKSLKDIAQEMGVSYVYMKVLHKKALILLRKYVK